MKRKKKKTKKAVTISVSTYDQVYLGNPLAAALDELAQSGFLTGTTVDDRKKLADLMVDKLKDKASATGLGAAIIRRIHGWLGGQLRDDVIHALSIHQNVIETKLNEATGALDEAKTEIKKLRG